MNLIDILIIFLIIVNLIYYLFKYNKESFNIHNYKLLYNSSKYIFDRYVENDMIKINIPILYINLDRSIDRKKYMETELKKISNNYSRIKAIDGKKIININEGIIDNVKYKNEYDNLSKSELGCLLSHLKALKYADNKLRMF